MDITLELSNDGFGILNGVSEAELRHIGGGITDKPINVNSFVNIRIDIRSFAGKGPTEAVIKKVEPLPREYSPDDDANMSMVVPTIFFAIHFLFDPMKELLPPPVRDSKALN